MDYIKREDALKIAWDEYDDGTPGDIPYRLERLPSADVEECKTGKWEKYGEDMQVCSACHKYWIWAGEMYDFKYCPNCGAKMEGNE